MQLPNYVESGRISKRKRQDADAALRAFFSSSGEPVLGCADSTIIAWRRRNPASKDRKPEICYIQVCARQHSSLDDLVATFFAEEHRCTDVLHSHRKAIYRLLYGLLCASLVWPQRQIAVDIVVDDAYDEEQKVRYIAKNGRILSPNPPKGPPVWNGRPY